MDTYQQKYNKKLKEKGWRQLSARVPPSEYSPVKDILDATTETIRTLIQRGVQHFRDESARKRG